MISQSIGISTATKMGRRCARHTFLSRRPRPCTISTSCTKDGDWNGGYPVPGVQFTVKSGKQSQKNRKAAQKAMNTEQSPVVSQ